MHHVTLVTLTVWHNFSLATIQMLQLYSLFLYTCKSKPLVCLVCVEKFIHSLINVFLFIFIGITHTAVVPLDLVKCRLQVDPDKYKNVLNGFKVTLREDGTRGLAKGWAPTFFGYSAQVFLLSN